MVASDCRLSTPRTNQLALRRPKMFKSAHIRLAIATLFVMGATAPLVIYGVLGSFSNMDNAPVNWVSGKFSARRDYVWFKERFDQPDTIVISWPGCTIHDKRLEALDRKLSESMP